MASRRGLAGVAIAIAVVALCRGADWPQFRGAASGARVSRDAAPPARWSESQNRAWVADLPGRGPSSPIVVRDRVIVTCSNGPNQDRLCVLAIDARDGKEIWRREFWATGRTLTHPFSAVAAPTPASDGKRIYAFYSSNDLVCLDLDGNLLWYRGLAHDWPKAGNDAGMSSSPVVVAETVVVQIENQGDSFAAGIDAATGETRWRVEREQVAGWCSPAVVPSDDGGRSIVLLQSASELTAHDARTGEQLWRYPARCSTIPSLVATPRRIYLPANGLTALELDENGRPGVAWQENRLGPSAGSPVLDESAVYVINGAGVLTCADAGTGRTEWQLRLGGERGRFWSTPVIAGDRLYAFRDDGTTSVVQLGQRGKLLGSYSFGETILASPAVADGALYIRSDRHLWKIAGS